MILKIEVIIDLIALIFSKSAENGLVKSYDILFDCQEIIFY